MLSASLSLSVHAEAWWYNRTLTKKDFKICMVGDPGTGKESQKDVAKLLRREKCDSIHFLGDLVYSKGIQTTKDENLEEKFLDVYEDIGSPGSVNLTLGNHDYDGNPTAWIAVAKENPQYFFPNPYYILNLNGVCITHIDTNLYLRPAFSLQGETQTKWLEQSEPRMKKECQRTIAITHHPFRNHGRHGNATGVVLDFLNKHVIGKYEFLFSGHEHQLADEGVDKGTRLFVSGAAGSSNKNAKAGYIVLDVRQVGQKIDIKPNFRFVE